MSYIQDALTRLNTRYQEIVELIPNPYYFTDEKEIISDGKSFGISDGGDDMYDGGNLLNTELTQTYTSLLANGFDGGGEFSIPITHTPAPNEGEGDYTDPPKDGVVVNGSNYFGTGSQYFTNMYPDLFVMIADNITVNEFSIFGGAGADGSGIDTGTLFPVSANGQNYTVFYKSIYSAGDPSINHIIIIPGNSSGLTHLYIDNDTNRDGDCAQGISDRKTIYYLLCARENGLQLNTEDAEAISIKFLEIVGNGSPTNNYPYPEVIFRVKTYDPLQFVGQNFPDSNINNILLNLQNQTVFIENWPYPLKHGDEFTLYGEQALQTLNAYNQINSGGTQLETLYYGVRGGYDPNATLTGGSMSFNGTTTYLTLPASSDWAVGTGDFTVEWFQYQQETGGDDRIFSVNSWPSASIACSMETGVDTFYFWTNGNMINGGSISSLYNTWAHIAACRSSGTLYLFVNGTEVYSVANTDDITDNTNPLSIGAQSIENNYYQGLITNFQFIKGTALYTTAFTPPTAPISPDANSKLCLLASSESALLTDSSPAAKTATNNGVTFSANTPF
jgi:hypothetical protein